MSDIAIRVDGLGKRYRIGKRERYRTLRDTLADVLQAPFRRRSKDTPESSEFWALKDVSFEVRQGEVIGIIGRNGAGKSTLLKILSRITEPTEGQVELHGRVGSLLEVGTGFHPELSGRENIYLNGAILGMKRAEIDRRFDEIVAFAEVEKFLDTPVKHYSSGMYVRLAFGVAAHLETEILVVDEVLAVGDAQFQKKCLGKMGDVAKQGRTVLLVSHNMTAIQSLCERTIWLTDGRVAGDGRSVEVVTEYLESNVGELVCRTFGDVALAPETQRVGLQRVQIVSSTPRYLTVKDSFQIEFYYWNRLDGQRLNLSMFLYNEQGVCVFNAISEPATMRNGVFRALCHIPGNLLNDGTHRCRLMIVHDTATILLDQHDAVVFEINDTARNIEWYGRWPGAVRVQLEWRVEFVEPLLDGTKRAELTTSCESTAPRT